MSTRDCLHFSCFRNPAEMSHTCRGTISLHGALIHTVDACTFVVSNGGTQTFHIKASTEVERQQWVTALELAKAKAIQAMESGLYLVIICASFNTFHLHKEYSITSITAVCLHIYTTSVLSIFFIYFIQLWYFMRNLF